MNNSGLLIPENISLLEQGFEKNCEPLCQNEEIHLLGYPEFQDGDELKLHLGNYLRTVNNDGFKKFEISQIIYGGNSGGPVINRSEKVIGVATEGKRLESSRAIPIEYLEDLQSL